MPNLSNLKRDVAAGVAKSPYGIATSGIESARQAGFYDPMGSPLLRQQRRREALRRALARRRRGAVASRLYGLDPMSARAAAQGAEAESGADVADFLNRSQFEEQQGNLGFARDLFSNRLASDEARAAERRANRFRPGAAIGGLAGRAAGAYFGGFGR